MKKILLIAILCTGISAAQAQVRIGLKVSPYLNTTSVDYTGPDTVGAPFSSAGDPGIRYSAGPFVDAFFGDNYAFSTGVFFSTRRTATETRTPNGQVETVVNLQYIQIPITIKLFTNEIADDLKLYFQLGGTADFKIAGSVKGNNAAPDGTRFFNTCLLVAAGVEYQMGTNTALVMGISYNRGLINILSEKQDREVANVNHNLIGLDLGIRF